MKRLFVVLATILVISILIAGCGKTTSSTSSTTSKPATTSSATSTSAATSTTSTTSKPATSTTATATAPSTTTTTSAAATSTTPAALTPKKGGTMNVMLDSVPPTAIGWPAEFIGDASSAPQLCIEPFLREGPKGEIYPWLAESYKVADDLKSISFVLRKGVKFHDGSDFNAQVAKWNLQNQIDAKRTPFWSSIDVIDDYNIRVNFTQWLNTNVRVFADGQSSMMVSKVAFDKNGLDWMRQNPVGTGPFKFVSFSRDVGFKTVKFDSYWAKDAQGTQLPYLNAVNILFVLDYTTQNAVMQSGGADMAIMEPGKRAADFKDMGCTVRYDLVTTYSLTPDTANADSPLAKQPVREAIEYAINKDALAQGLSYGYWGGANQIPGPATAPYNKNFTLARTYDLAKAKSLLASAGYANGLDITLICIPVSLNKDADVAIQADLKKAGINATLEFPEAAKWQSYNTAGWKNALVFQPFAGFPNWNYTLQFYFSPTAVNNKSWLRTPEFLDAYNKTLSSINQDISLMQACADTMTKQCSVIPVMQQGRGWAYKPYVMTAGLLERGLSPYWKPEQAWLNK
jgi:peptide/nickel transport system substrate-binding protein